MVSLSYPTSFVAISHWKTDFSQIILVIFVVAVPIFVDSVAFVS